MNPARVGGYRIESSLGQGGMGEVFLAWDERLQRHVAIKRILTEKSLDQRHLVRFRREARAVARLNHPAIVQIFDVLDTDEGECIVMEYVEGTSLARRIADGEIDLPLTLKLAEEIADGLGEAHSKGLVHRDLKPSNVMVTTSGHAKILDFGLVRALPVDTADTRAAVTVGETLTESGALIGTVHAMSPEQASGSPVDHRSDLFAFGGLLYEMLAGRPPFRGENLLDTLWRVTNEEPEPLASLAPTTPPALLALVEKLLAKDPAERPQDTREVAAAIASIATVLSGAIPAFAGHPELFEGLSPAPATSLPGTAPALSESLGSSPQPMIRVLVMTGLVDGTRLVESLGDSRAVELASRHDRMARDLLAPFDGLEVDKLDGILALFERPADAVAYALEYHQQLAVLAAELDLPLSARVGIHLGEIFVRRNPPQDVARGAKPWEVDGLARPIATQVMALAGGCQTLLTHGAFELARRAAVHKLADRELRWLAHGSYVVEDAEEPLEIFEVGVEGFAPLREPGDSPRAHRVLAHGEEATLGWRPAIGQTIPGRRHWVLEERVGEGGFGEVWLARHKSGDERIFKFCFEAARLRGLKREVTLFRLLKEALGHRRDITRILDWNFDEAPYFLEAEYTASGSLVEWSDQQGGIAGVPLATRLELIAEIADALAAAHSVGILHKDVKPENVLIDSDLEGRPRAQLTDFGIGLVTDRQVLAAEGVTVLGFTETLGTSESTSSGSLRYMAPELLEGKPASVQADVYSLGVLLYQSVVGDFARALAPGWRRQVSDELLAEDIARFVDGSPERRPGSALEVAERLRSLETRRRQLDDQRRQRQEAETARRKLERAQRRRRISAAVAAAALGILIVVSVLALLALSARHEAESRRRQAESLIDFLLQDLPAKLAAVGRLDLLDAAGDKALEYFEAVPEDQLTPHEVFRRSQALSQIGEVRLAEGRPDAALELFQESLALARELAARQPGRVEWQQGLAARHFWIGRVFWDRGELDAAAERFQNQLALTRDLAERHPDDLEMQLDAARALSNLAFVQHRRGDVAAALAAQRSNLAIRKQVAQRAPADEKRQLELAEQYSLVGEALFELGDLREALRHFEADRDIAAAWAARDPANATWQEQLGQSHNLIGRLFEAAGHGAQAEEHFEDHLRIAQALVALDPVHTLWQFHLAISSSRLGRHLAARGQLEEGADHLRRSFEILEDLVSRDPEQTQWRRELAVAGLGLGEVSEARGDPRGAHHQARAALELLEPLVDQTPTDRTSRRRLCETLLLLGRALANLSEPAAATDAWRRAAATIEPFAGGSKDLSLLGPWSEALLQNGRGEEAEAVRARIRELSRQELG